MDSCAPANHFFRHYLLRGSIGSVKSWAPTGRALYDYFSFLQAHALSWDDVNRGEAKTLLAAYRDYCLRVANLARNTVRNRLLYVCEFYAFALRQQWIARLPFSYEARRGGRERGFLGHLRRGQHISARDVMPRAHQNLPKFLSAEQIKQLLAAATNLHHQMIIRLALGSGLRKGELATFPLAYIFNPDRGNDSRNVRIDLEPSDGNGIKTKGSRTRAIFVSRTLMRDLHQYVVHHRGERASLSKEPQRQLFLNQDGNPYSADGKSLDRIVRMIGQKAGFRVWTHMLRHTYATHALVALQRHREGNRLEPLVFLQKQLGHASPQSTLIYLHLIQELADQAVLAYDEELDELTRGSNGKA
jgi:integrase